MALLGSNKQSKSVQFAQQSDTVIGGFLKFSKDLSKINADIEFEDKSLAVQQDTIAIQRASLAQTKERNQRFIDKVDKFLNED